MVNNRLIRQPGNIIYLEFRFKVPLPSLRKGRKIVKRDKLGRIVKTRQLSGNNRHAR